MARPGTPEWWSALRIEVGPLSGRAARARLRAAAASHPGLEWPVDLIARRRGPVWTLAKRTLLPPYRALRYEALPRLGHLLTLRHSPHQVVQRWPDGEIPLGPKVCVFVHWDPAGEVREHVLHYLRSLASCGVSVLFVSNSGTLQPGAWTQLRSLCAGVLVRRNLGYDFGAWREGFEHLSLPRTDTEMVLMANDSVYGPLRPLADVLARFDFTQADAWGCTDSHQLQPHLQSYLMAFSPAVVASSAWRRFWAAVRPTWSKLWLVRLYEVGLTTALQGAGFRCRALWPYLPLVDAMTEPPSVDGQRQIHRARGFIAAGLPLNPTNALWRPLLEAGFPFIKRDLLRSNPAGVLDAAEWRQAAGAIPGANIEIIAQDANR